MFINPSFPPKNIHFADMEILRTPSEMSEWSYQQIRAGKMIGFVPTMGSLHAGHTTLLDTSATHCDTTVLSLFVNPTQFNVQSDFDKYPRDFNSDIKLASLHNTNAVYAPSTEIMYPAGFNSFVEPGHTADPMEGAGRPGHFRGVTTVVSKLFHAVQPNFAFFGKKDFQQLAVVRQMVQELDMPIRIIGVETVRDADGLALSSRNARLSAECRKQAPVIFEALQHGRNMFQQGCTDPSEIEAAITSHIQTAPDAKCEYVQVVDAQSLVRSPRISSPSVICVACWFDDVRLIDNLELGN